METWSFPLLVLVVACLEGSWCVAFPELWPRKWEQSGAPGLNPLVFLELIVLVLMHSLGM